jgi:hypothetical protein
MTTTYSGPPPKHRAPGGATMPMIPSQMRCDHCQRTYIEYIIHDTVWDSMLRDGHLCVDCVEKALGRKLTATDFPDTEFNEMTLRRLR